MFKVKNKDTRATSRTCSKVSIVNFRVSFSKVLHCLKKSYEESHYHHNIFNPFMYNVGKWPNFKNLVVFTTQEFQSMLDHFSTLCMKGLRRCKGVGKNWDLGFLP